MSQPSMCLGQIGRAVWLVRGLCYVPLIRLCTYEIDTTVVLPACTRTCMHEGFPYRTLAGRWIDIIVSPSNTPLRDVMRGKANVVGSKSTVYPHCSSLLLLNASRYNAMSSHTKIQSHLEETTQSGPPRLRPSLQAVVPLTSP